MSGKNEFRSLLGRSSAALGAHAMAAALMFVATLLVTRVLGPREAGLFFLAQTCLLILSVLSRLGLDHFMVRLVSTSADNDDLSTANGLLLRAFGLTMPVACGLSLLLYQGSDWLSSAVFGQPAFRSVIQAASLAVAPVCCFQLLAFALQGRRMVVASILLGTAALPAGTIFAMVPLGLGQLGLGSPNLGSWGLGPIESATGLMKLLAVVAWANVLLGSWLWLRHNRCRFRFEATRWSAIGASAMPLYAASIVTLVSTWAPQLVLATAADPDQIAMLTNAQRTSALVSFFLLAVNSAAAPVYASIYRREGAGKLRPLVLKINGASIVTTVPVLLSLFLLAPWLLSWFGPYGETGGWILRILLLGQAVNAATGSVSVLLVMSGHERRFRNATAVAAAVGCLLSATLIPAFGVVGAATAIAMSFASANVVAAVHVYRLLNINVLVPDIRGAYELLWFVPRWLGVNRSSERLFPNPSNHS